MNEMTSMERALTTLGHQEPDRVPVFLLLSMHGAKELGLSIKEYFSKAEYVIEGQLRLKEKFGHDCYYPFFYTPIEMEAMGGNVIFRTNGPPNAGAPIFRNEGDIKNFKTPEVGSSPVLQRVIDAIKGIKKVAAEETPIIGVALSPFSLPVIQLGFEAYLELLQDHEALFWHLMEKNQSFCVEWANAQLEAGATAICYFDPLSSPTVVPRELFLETGYKVACETFKLIHGPTATHLASGRSLSVAADIATTGTAVLGASVMDDFTDLKEVCCNKLTILGALDGISMRTWDAKRTEQEVKKCIKHLGIGGGFILSDNHGEIPWQVPDEVLHNIVKAARQWGRYPLSWVEHEI